MLIWLKMNNEIFCIGNLAFVHAAKEPVQKKSTKQERNDEMKKKTIILFQQQLFFNHEIICQFILALSNCQSMLTICDGWQRHLFVAYWFRWIWIDSKAYSVERIIAFDEINGIFMMYPVRFYFCFHSMPVLPHGADQLNRRHFLNELFLFLSRAPTHIFIDTASSEKQNSVTLHFSIEPIGMRIVSPTTFFESSCYARDFSSFQKWIVQQFKFIIDYGVYFPWNLEEIEIKWELRIATKKSGHAKLRFVKVISYNSLSVLTVFFIKIRTRTINCSPVKWYQWQSWVIATWMTRFDLIRFDSTNLVCS